MAHAWLNFLKSVPFSILRYAFQVRVPATLSATLTSVDAYSHGSYEKEQRRQRFQNTITILYQSTCGVLTHKCEELIYTLKC